MSEITYKRTGRYRDPGGYYVVTMERQTDGVRAQASSWASYETAERLAVERLGGEPTIVSEG